MQPPLSLSRERWRPGTFRVKNTATGTTEGSRRAEEPAFATFDSGLGMPTCLRHSPTTCWVKTLMYEAFRVMSKNHRNARSAPDR